MEGKLTDSSVGFIVVSLQDKVYIVIPKDNINSSKLTQDGFGWKHTTSRSYIQPGDSVSFTFTE